MAGNDKITEIQKYLQRYIKGQDHAIHLISILLVNRERIEKIKTSDIDIDYPREELTPPNILLIGPSGCGKTELTKRIAEICNRFWFRIPCTVFSATGYVGKNTEDILTYAIETAIQKVQEEYRKDIIENNLEKLLLQAIKPPVVNKTFITSIKQYVETYRKNPNSPILEEQLYANIPIPVFDMNGPNVTYQYVKDTVKNIIETLIEGELVKKHNEIVKKAIQKVENGIIMLDEIDKIVGGKVDNVSMYGVQRELLAIVEGSTFHTKYGTIDTKNILFIAAGAFQVVSVDEMLPELRGRFPVVIELKPLTKEDFINILKHSKLSPLKKYQAIMKADGITVTFTDDAIEFLAELATKLNEKEQIGARRLWELFDKHLIELYLLDKDTVITSEMLKQMLDKKSAKCNGTETTQTTYKEAPCEMYI